MSKKTQTPEIIWNIVNSLLAGVLVFLGAFTAGDIDTSSIVAAFVVAGIAALSQFRDYWTGEKKEYSTKLFTFVK